MRPGPRGVRPGFPRGESQDPKVRGSESRGGGAQDPEGRGSEARGVRLGTQRGEAQESQGAWLEA